MAELTVSGSTHPILKDDYASEWMGIEVVALDEGHATIRMSLRQEMLNGFGMAHGGMIFAFGDTAFALACNPANPGPGDDGNITVAAGVDINFLKPAFRGQVLTAIANRRASTGRSGLYDIQIYAADPGRPGPRRDPPPRRPPPRFRANSPPTLLRANSSPSSAAAAAPSPRNRNREPQMTQETVAPTSEAVLDREETISRDELEALQLSRLQHTLAYAYDRVPLYKRKFDDAGVHPTDLRELSDLGKFPFTTKEDLRLEYPFGMFAVPQHEVARIHASSGTTGRATVVGYTKKDLADWAKLVARSLRASGVRPGMKVHNAYGYGLFTGGMGAHAGAEALGCTVIPISGGQTERQITLIQDFKPDAILATPTYLLTIADAMMKQGIDPASTSLKYAVLGAEPWTEEMRHELETTMNIKACDIYGLSEVMGPGVAGEAVETQDGSHIWEDHFRPEIIDAFDPSVVLGDGEHGELVFTSLTKEALPIIRYRTKDLTRLLPGTARPAHRRMGRITGRSDDMIILRGVNLFPSQIEEIALRIPELSPHFQLELTRPEGQRMDQLTVKIERRESVTVEGVASAAKVLQQQIKIHVGSSCTVDVVEPGSLERSNGKLRRIYDMRPKA